MKRIYIFCSLLLTLLFSSCKDYDDSAIQDKLNDFKERIAALQEKADKLNEEVSKLGYLTGGNVITSVTQNSDGQYVITYKDSNNEEKAVVVATREDVIEIPVLGVRLDDKDLLYYWTTTIGNETDWLKDNAGKKVPVCGYTPEMGVNADGYWTVDGEILKDNQGNPITATTDETSIFKNITKTKDGYLEITLGNGEKFTLEVFNSLNLKLKSDAVTSVSDPSQPLKIEYEVTGASAENAIVAIAQAVNVKATLDKETRLLTVTFENGFDEGHVIVTAYDLHHLVIRPLLFKKN